MCVMKKKRVKNFCPKCHRYKLLTRHHIFPKRNFGKKYNEQYLYLCRNCHDALEKLIPFEKKKKQFYIEVVANFLKEK